MEEEKMYFLCDDTTPIGKDIHPETSEEDKRRIEMWLEMCKKSQK